VDRRTLLTGSLGLLAAPSAVRAQQVTKVPRIGVLRVGPLPPDAGDAFRQGLREHGYIEGQSIIVEYGSAQRVTQLSAVAAELISLKIDVLVASGTASVLPARNATSTIPVVFVAAIDPVART
jgi:putative tryptophan/tyrosine transport system substrate-binding protein